MSKIKHVCSLGFNCHVSQMLKDNGLKTESYPFDWIMSNLNVVKNCIQDDFKTFLDKDYYIDIGSPDKCGHKIYCDNMFVHHNPLTNISDYEYFKRCVDRFRKLLSCNDNKLFIISIIDCEHGVENLISETLIKQFVELNDIISNSTSNSKLLLIVNYPNKKTIKKKITTIKNLTILEINTLSTNNGTNYLDDNDNKFLKKQINKLFSFNIFPIKNIN